jgi:hypothetical protein
MLRGLCCRSCLLPAGSVGEDLEQVAEDVHVINYAYIQHSSTEGVCWTHIGWRCWELRLQRGERYRSAIRGLREQEITVFGNQEVIDRNVSIRLEIGTSTGSATHSLLLTGERKSGQMDGPGDSGRRSVVADLANGRRVRTNQ